MASIKLSSHFGQPTQQGYLEKKGTTGRRAWQSRWFVLRERSHLLEYYKSPQDVPTIPPRKPNTTVIDLRNVKAVFPVMSRSSSTPSGEFVIELHKPMADGRTSYNLRAQTVVEAQQWVHALTERHMGTWWGGSVNYRSQASLRIPSFNLEEVKASDQLQALDLASPRSPDSRNSRSKSVLEFGSTGSDQRRRMTSSTPSIIRIFISGHECVGLRNGVLGIVKAFEGEDSMRTLAEYWPDEHDTKEADVDQESSILVGRARRRIVDVAAAEMPRNVDLQNIVPDPTCLVSERKPLAIRLCGLLLACNAVKQSSPVLRVLQTLHPVVLGPAEDVVHDIVYQQLPYHPENQTWSVLMHINLDLSAQNEDQLTKNMPTASVTANHSIDVPSRDIWPKYAEHQAAAVHVQHSRWEKSIHSEDSHEVMFQWKLKLAFDVSVLECVGTDFHIVDIEYGQDVPREHRDEVKYILRPLIPSSLPFMLIWRRSLLELPVAKDLPRLLKGISVQDDFGRILFPKALTELIANEDGEEPGSEKNTQEESTADKLYSFLLLLTDVLEEG